MATAWTIGVAKRLDVRGHVAEWIGLLREQRPARQLHRDVWVFGERGRVGDQGGERLLLRGLRRYAHMVDNEGQSGMPLRDRAKPQGLAAREEHDRDTGLLGERPVPVGGAIGQP